MNTWISSRKKSRVTPSTGLRQASVSDLLTGRISKDSGYIAIIMRRYPRFVRRELRDEYISEMAPDWKLFEEWLAIKRATDDHEAAFRRSHYEARFSITTSGIEHLKRLIQLSRTVDVYLVCQCKVGQRCHRELHLLIARDWFHGRVEGPFNNYPIFQKRMAKDQVLEIKRAA